MAEAASSKRSTSATRKPPSRPSTPLRPSSRTSLRDSQSFTPGRLGTSKSAFPLEALEPAFAELSDSMADMEANFMHLQLMHESLSRFNESFASFLYGMNMNAFCVDFPEAPIPESFTRAAAQKYDASSPSKALSKADGLAEETFLTTDTSFVEHPPSSKMPSKFATPAAPEKRGQQSGASKRAGHATAAGGSRGGGGGSSKISGPGGTGTSRGGAAAGRGRGDARGRASGIARGRTRGAR